METSDRAILAGIVGSWGHRLVAAHPLGREVGARGVMSDWRITTTGGTGDGANALDEHVLYLEDATSADDIPEAAGMIASDGSSAELGVDLRCPRIDRSPML